MAKNCAQITQKAQRQPHDGVSEVNFYIYGYFLALLKPKRISQKLNSLNEEYCSRKSHLPAIR